MKKYILIENHTGFVWGSAVALSAQDACAKVDADIGGELCEYIEKSRPDFANESGYSVYDGTGFDLDSIGGGDGQNAELIAAVAKLPFVAYFEAKMTTE